MLPADKIRFDEFQAGIISMGLRLQVETSGNIKSWLLLAANRPIVRIYYEPSNPFNERFTYYPIRSPQES